MRVHTPALLLLPALYSAGALAGSPSISAVTLHPGSATVTRVAEVTPGMSQVVFSGLPANFDPRTLRASANGPARIGQIISENITGAAAVNPQEAELEARIVALQDQLASLGAAMDSAEMVRQYLARISAGEAPAPKAPPPDAAAVTAMAEAIGKGSGDVLARIQRLGVEKRGVSAQIEVLQRQLAQLRAGVRDSRTVTVKVSARQPTTLALTYQVPNAGWQPAYRAELDTQASRLKLERLATITQRTGEDWQDVRLTLSTTQPRRSPLAAEPQPWLLSWHPPQAAEAQMRLQHAPAAAMKALAADTLSGAPASPEAVMVSHGAFASEFVVPTPVSLPADGRDLAVSLSEDELAARHYLRVTPRLERAAVVMAEAERPAGVWLAGHTQLFRDGSYVGASQWNPDSAERFTFSFGRDERLRVAVDQVEGKDGTEGVFEKRNERRVVELYSLHNTHPRAVDLLVLEPTPVSGSDRIKVQAAFTPKPGISSWQQRRGVVGWEHSLAAGATAKFTVDYRIEYPKEGRIEGLD